MAISLGASRGVAEAISDQGGGHHRVSEAGEPIIDATREVVIRNVSARSARDGVPIILLILAGRRWNVNHVRTTASIPLSRMSP